MSTIRDDGLRYKAKKAGSQFQPIGKEATARSCLLCGTHKQMAEGRMLQLAGAKQFVCLVCRPVKAPASSN